MKRIFLYLLFTTFCVSSFAQVKDTVLKKIPDLHQNISLGNDTLLVKHDLSLIWLQTKNKDVYGFIGNDYLRIRVKFISVTKDNMASDIYHVYGKSMVKNNITEFKGTLKITNILKKANTPQNMARYVLTGDYNFAESRDLPHSGVFKGFFVTKIYVDKEGKVYYDDLNKDSKNYFNNQFSGEWYNYNNTQTQRCNWGDFRIPGAGELDAGTDNFFPYAKYAEAGWQSLVEINQGGEKGEASVKEEEREWWK